MPLLAKVTLQQSSEACSVACFVLGHLMHGVVDSVEAGSLGVLCDAELVLACTCLSSCALLKVCLRIPHALAQQLSKAAGVIGLLKGIALESLGNLRIALAEP